MISAHATHRGTSVLPELRSQYSNTFVPSLVVVCGPTAAGKTGLAIAIAQRYQALGQLAVIISADSRQIYRDFDIGTAKPSPTEQAQVTHYLIDHWPPTVTVTLADYQQVAQAHIAACQAQGGVPLLVGGTGLYIKAIVNGLTIPPVPPHAELRSQLLALGQPQCYAILQQVDPVLADRLHPHDQTRTIRALEVFYVTGQPLSAQQGEAPPAYAIRQIGLNAATPNHLRSRITQRTMAMFEQGLVAEVASLVDRYGADLPLLQTLGYAEVVQYQRGELTLAEAIAHTIRRTNQFAKRQRTWFRADERIHWFDSDAPDLVDQAWADLQTWQGELTAGSATPCLSSPPG